jgi:hypothetical protein
VYLRGHQPLLRRVLESSHRLIELLELEQSLSLHGVRLRVVRVEGHNLVAALDRLLKLLELEMSDCLVHVVLRLRWLQLDEFAVALEGTFELPIPHEDSRLMRVCLLVLVI